MGDDKKPAAKPAAKKDDKKPAAKPAAKGAWDMKAKIGDVTAWQEWDAYIAMPQSPVDKNMKFTWNEKCNVDNWKAFLKPVVFGKLTAKPREFAVYKNMFEVLKFLNTNLSNSTAQEVYERLMGKSWFARFKANMKITGKKIKAGFNKAGKHIKGAFNKIGVHVKAGAKKIGAKIKTGLKVKGKTGLKIHAKAPKLKIGVKGKAGAKAKVGAKAKGGLKLKVTKPKITGKLKVGGKAKVGAKAKVGVKAKGKAKVGVKAKVGKKMRRLQAKTPAKTDTGIKDGFLPGLPTDNKKPADNKKTDNQPSNAETTVTTGADGLPVSKYTSDVAVPNLQGDSDQTAPKSSNLIKFAFMLFAAFMTMY